MKGLSVPKAATKKTTKKLPGVSDTNHQYALKHDRRTFVFSMTFRDGSTVVSEGSVLPRDCTRLSEIFQELMKLSGK
jgi:hypothetical protein